MTSKHATEATDLTKTPEGAARLVLKVIEWARNAYDTKASDDEAVHATYHRALSTLDPEAAQKASQHGRSLGFLDDF